MHPTHVKTVEFAAKDFSDSLTAAPVQIDTKAPTVKILFALVPHLPARTEVVALISMADSHMNAPALLHTQEMIVKLSLLHVNPAPAKTEVLVPTTGTQHTHVHAKKDIMALTAKMISLAVVTCANVSPSCPTSAVPTPNQ